jgi:thioesterase domain-containing protein
MLPDSLEEIVTESLEHIRSVQPHGPYRLLGWSFGGIVAHMIATRLQTDGEQVDRLVLFDAYPPDTQSGDEPTGAERGDRFWREIALGTNLVIPPEAADRELDAQVVHALAHEQSHILGTFSLHQLDRLAAVLANNSRLHTTTRPGIFDGDMTLFVATRHTPGLDRTHISPEAWRPYCRGAIHRIEVDAEHHRMLSVDALGKMDALPF